MMSTLKFTDTVTYAAPDIETIEVATEKGFADSNTPPEYGGENDYGDM